MATVPEAIALSSLSGNSAGGDRIVIIERQTNIIPPLLQGKESERGWIAHKARCEATSIWRPPL
ncbi:hypothetical protein [Scytonema sp. PCC 10023]|uniref:hypothetical protein n=1 Tax=Scytonema sp. PCC 10023 TaxID=1680591 RepID=UPI0039C752A2